MGRSECNRSSCFQKLHSIDDRSLGCDIACLYASTHHGTNNILLCQCVGFVNWPCLWCCANVLVPDLFFSRGHLDICHHGTCMVVDGIGREMVDMTDKGMECCYGC